MANAHRTNVLVTSCLKTPVDPNTKAPLASYERERVLPYTATGHMDNRDYEKELESEESGSDFCDEDRLPKAGHTANDHLDLSEIFFSNEEYYSKLEELKRAHLRTMADLENMYRHQLQLRSNEPLDTTALDGGHRLLWSNTSPAAAHRLRRSVSAVELRWDAGQSDGSDKDGAAGNEVEKGLLLSPKEHIKNMWRDFLLSPQRRYLSSSSLHSLPGHQRTPRHRAGQKRRGEKDGELELWKHRMTVPQPFQMTLREAERRRRGFKTRSEVEQENTELRRQVEELSECQKKFHASPVPAHVHLPLYEELQERKEARRRTMLEEQHLRGERKPFSFLERERLKKEQKQLRDTRLSNKDPVTPFKAKPVPRSVYAAASGEQMKEEQLYRSIKIQMRAQELLQSAALPASMLTQRLSERNKTRSGAAGRGDGFSHRPHINTEVPDFNASYRLFQKNLEKRKAVKPTTACKPFELRTSQIPSNRERILPDPEKQRDGPRLLRWPFISAGPTRTPNSSLCSSLSGSLEVLPSKVTDATKKRHEAVRKALEQRRKAEEEEERWKERQKQREKKLQRVVLKRAEAHDPHRALSQTHHSKLTEFRKQDLLRRKEYQQEIREMQERVEGRPLLLEQVAQRNAKQAAEKRYTETLQGCDVTEEFISSKAAQSGSGGVYSSTSRHSDLEEEDAGFEAVHYRKVFLDDEDVDERGGGGRTGGEESDEASLDHGGGEDADGRPADDTHRYSDESYQYSESYSDDSEHDADTGKQEAAE